MADPITDAAILDAAIGTIAGDTFVTPAVMTAAGIGDFAAVGAGAAAGAGVGSEILSDVGNAATSLATPETASLPAFDGAVSAAAGVPDAYLGSLTGQAADLMAAYGGNIGSVFNAPSIIDTVKSAAQIAGPAMSIGSGILGLDNAMQQRRLAQMAMKQQPNMWQASGGQQLATNQLMQLMNDPSAAAANDPSFKLMQESALRANAQQGQTSGAVAKGAAMAANDWYGQRMAQYGGLAGAPGNPTGAMQVGGQILGQSNDLMSRALASIGYGVTSATGGSTALPPAVQQWLVQQKISGGMAA